MKRMILLLLLSALAACATPRESCLKSATKDLAIVDELILQTQANLSRGYAIDREAYISSRVDLCLGSGNYGYRGRGVGVGWTYCTVPDTRYREKPVPIDGATEQRKLAELKQTRARLVREAEAGLAQCNAKYPLG